MFIQSFFFPAIFQKSKQVTNKKILHSMEALEKAKQLCLKIIFSEFIRHFSVRHFNFLNKIKSKLFIYIIYYLAYRLTIKKVSLNTTLCIFNSHPVHHTILCLKYKSTHFWFKKPHNSLIRCCKGIR